VNKTILFIIAVIVALIQLAAPLSVVFTQEDVLANGKEFKFKTRPVDPTDPFRGAFLALHFDADRFEGDTTINIKEGDKAFVTIGLDSAGFVAVKSISKEKPDAGDYLSVRVRWADKWQKENRKIIHFDFPFDEYYIEESKAKRVEEDYDRANDEKENQLAYAVIKIKDGDSAIQDLIINGKSATDIMKELNKGK
jgi:uncharacterized membrane-anchored protein